MDNILEKYESEFTQDVKLDRFNLLEKSMMLPAIKHKWVGRLIRHKISLDKLKKLKFIKKQEIVEHIKKESSVLLANPILEKKVEQHELIKKINEKITQETYYIDYLEKIEQILRSISYNIQSMVDMIKLEET